MGAMAELPDEVWRKILELGTEKSKLSYKDLCLVSIACRRFNRLSNEDHLWSSLLSLDFFSQSPFLPPPLNSNSKKSIYKSKFLRDKERRLAAHRRALLRIQSQIAVHAQNLRRLKGQLVEEKERLKGKLEELSNLERQRRASVAMKVWQPEVIRDIHKKMVQQCIVPVEFRMSALEMEIKLCRKQIGVFDKNHSDEKHRLDAAKEQLVFLKYHPLQDHLSTGTFVNESDVKMKKLKQCHKSKALFLSPSFYVSLCFLFLSRTFPHPHPKRKAKLF